MGVNVVGFNVGNVVGVVVSSFIVDKKVGVTDGANEGKVVGISVGKADPVGITVGV